MINLKKVLKFNKKETKLTLFCLFLGFLIGFLLIKRLNINPILEELKNINLYLMENHINYIGYHFLIVSLLSISSFLLIGIFLMPIYLIYECACIFFNIYTLMLVYKLNGLIFAIFYCLITKFIFLFLIIKIFKISLKISTTIIKKEPEMKETLKKYVKILAICFGLIMINDIILYFFGSKILSLLLFIIK